MTETTLAAIIGALVGGLFTLGAVFLQRTRKVITYEISSMPLLRFKPLDNTIRIAVDKSVLSDNPADKGTFEQVTSAFGFQITLLNKGNEDIEKPNIDIQLDKAAKIVSYEIQLPSSPGYDITAQKDPSRPNILRILLPFINKKEIVVIRLITTRNSRRECKINVLGLGIKSRKLRDLTGIIALAYILFAFALIPISLFIPNSFWLSIGGSYTPEKAQPPIWVFIILGITFLSMILVLERMKRANKRLKKDWR